MVRQKMNKYMAEKARLRTGLERYRVTFDDGREQVVEATSRADATVKACGPGYRGRLPRVELAKLAAPARTSSQPKRKGRRRLFTIVRGGAPGLGRRHGKRR